MTRIKEFNFFKFLVDIGRIFTKLYFEYENFKKEVEQYEHKCATNYECLLLVLCSCKNNKYNKLLFGNFDAYYAIKYMNIITNSIYYAIDINYKLSTSTQNYKNILNYFINELFFRICENEDEQFKEKETFIKESIKVYWCNSIFFMEEEL